MLTNWRLGTRAGEDRSEGQSECPRSAVDDSGRAPSAQRSLGAWNTANAPRSQLSRLRRSGPRKLRGPLVEQAELGLAGTTGRVP
jgi:hypothetical protein